MFTWLEEQHIAPVLRSGLVNFCFLLFFIVFFTSDNMSRHKLVKNLDLDDELDDYDGGEDYDNGGTDAEG
jgi:hypothetical protein